MTALQTTDERERFWAKVDRRGPWDCWPWEGYCNDAGYGIFTLWLRGPRHRAHRLSYEEQVGSIPEGLQLDHLCRDRRCCNPDHLEPVTRRENLRRGVGFVGENARKTHCPQGHEYDEENTYVHQIGCKTMRKCRACAREYQRHRRAVK